MNDHTTRDPDNVLRGRFAQKADAFVAAAATSTGRHQALQSHIADYVETKSRDKIMAPPQSLASLGAATKSFARDLGMMPQIDAKSMSNSMTSAAQLRQKIKLLKGELNDQIGMLHEHSDKYVRAAEGVKHWIDRAELFTAKHPSLTWLIKHAMHEQ